MESSASPPTTGQMISELETWAVRLGGTGPRVSILRLSMRWEVTVYTATLDHPAVGKYSPGLGGFVLATSSDGLDAALAAAVRDCEAISAAIGVAS